MHLVAIRMDLTKQWQAREGKPACCGTEMHGTAGQRERAAESYMASLVVSLREHARIDETRMMMMFCQPTASVVLRGF